VRLAELLFRPLSSGLSEAQWDTWRQVSLAVVRRLPMEDVGIFVVDHPERPSTLVSCGAAVAVPRLPNPWHPEGRAGYVQWMATEPAFRRQGYARAVLRAVLAWFGERGIDNVELHATEEGKSLYRSEGFWRGRGGEAMRRRPWDPPPEGA